MHGENIILTFENHGNMLQDKEANVCADKENGLQNCNVAVILTMSFSAIWGVSEQKAVFDVPASSYTADANTLLLLSGKQSGDMPVDSSPVNRKIIATEIGYVPGKSGQALSFNGKSSYIEIPDSRISDKDIFTVEFWIKPARKTRSKSETIFRDGTVPEQGRLSAFVDRQGHLNFIIYNEGRPSVTSKSALASGQWTHVAIVAKRNGYMRLYINGVLEDIEKVAKWSPFGSLKIAMP